jgi:hypothetical protein
MNTFLHDVGHWSMKLKYVKFEVFTSMTMKNAISWDLKPRGSFKNRLFGGTYLLHHHGNKNGRTRDVTRNCYKVVRSLPIVVTLMMKAIRSCETSVLTRAAWYHIQEDGILHCN